MIIQEKKPTVITINNKEITQSFLKHFDNLWNQETKVLRGLDAIQQIFEEMLDYGHCDFIGAKGYFIDKRKKYFEKWKKKALEKKFTMRNIVDISTKNHPITKLPFAKTKYTLPKEFAELSVFWIYGNKVVISNWMENEPIITIIENKYLNKVYRKQFELLWKKKFTAAGTGFPC